jgi:hypothetical protein
MVFTPDVEELHSSSRVRGSRPHVCMHVRVYTVGSSRLYRLADCISSNRLVVSERLVPHVRVEVYHIDKCGSLRYPPMDPGATPAHVHGALRGNYLSHTPTSPWLNRTTMVVPIGVSLSHAIVLILPRFYLEIVDHA